VVIDKTAVSVTSKDLGDSQTTSSSVENVAGTTTSFWVVEDENLHMDVSLSMKLAPLIVIWVFCVEGPVFGVKEWRIGEGA